ncbi:OR6C2 protein, partial [Crocuta crocuta]
KTVMKNHSAITFILLGLTDNPVLQVFLSVFLFFTYIFTVAGNLIIILLTLVDSHLKTPMYFFLRNFSILEIILTTVCVPRFLYSLTTGDKSVTYNACIIQLFFVILIGATEFFLLTAMCYDRYVAICKPLHYSTIMNERVCTILVLCCWLIGLVLESLLTWCKAVMRNHTAVTTFILLGLTDDPKMQVLLFVFLFLTYILSVAGNLIIIALTLLDSHLKTPMYFFLQNFSFLEVSFTTVCIPRFLYMMTTGDNTVTYNACATQLFFIVLFGATEFFLLVAMSYDRYVAICKPLHYTIIMNNRVCTILILCCWFAGLLIILPPLGMGLQLEFCDSNVIDHFGCDVSPILQITCSDTVLIERIVLSFAVLTLIITLVCVVLSYTYIIKTILQFPSAQQRKKAFSTCSSHM